MAKTIDAHVHAFPDAIAERAIAKLEVGCPWRACARGTVGELVASMDAAGVDVSVVCAIATRPDQAEGVLNWCAAIRSDRVLPLPSVHPDTPDRTGWLDRIAAAGFPGVKLHPMYQEFVIDEPRMDEMYTACESLGLVIAFHCGRDIGYPPDDDRAAPARAARVLDRFGGLKVICTHMGGWRMWEESDAVLVGRGDVYLETSFSLEALGRERAAEMIRRHGADRVLFGSDWPWRSQQADLERLADLPLGQAQLSRVRGSNAASLLGA